MAVYTCTKPCSPYFHLQVYLLELHHAIRRLIFKYECTIQNVFEPYTKFNSLVAKNFADLTNLQLEAARNYANIGLAQMFANSEVKDMQSMVNCTTKQLETMNKLSQQMIEDGKSWQH